MARYRRAWILLCLGLILIAGTALLFKYLGHSPAGKPRILFDQAEFDRSMNKLLEEKSRCEDLIRSALRRDRPHFEAIVKLVEKQDLAEDKSASFYFPKGGPADPLRRFEESPDRFELGEFCKRNTLLHAVRRGGILYVKVVMCEMGHAGTYAVMYASKELTLKEIEDQLVPHAVERLDPHWWAVIEWY